MTVQEVADLLRLKVSVVYKAGRLGQIPGFRVILPGARRDTVRFIRSEVEDYVLRGK